MKGTSLMGSHRTGKTTLAKAYAEKHGIEFIPMSVAPAYEACGIPMGQVNDFADRMAIQDAALDLYVKALMFHNGSEFITDRCFLDLIAYTLADYPQTPTEHESTWFLSYCYKCIQLNKEYFDQIMLLRPGIPLEPDATSWSADLGVVAKVDACMLWAADQGWDVYDMPKNVLLPKLRMKVLEDYIDEKV